MNILKLFTGSFDKIIDSAGNAIDKIVTSDEERLALKNELVKIKAEQETIAKQLALQFEKEITTRHANDMAADSWLSRNIRPMGLLVTMATIYVLVYFTTFSDLTELQVEVLQSWIPALVGIMGAMITFYYGSRGFEKITKIKQGKKND